MCKKQNASKKNITIIAAMAVMIFAAYGTAQNVIKISSYDELRKIGSSSDYPESDSYELTGNIDASASRTLNGGLGHMPIGTELLPFRGTFDGKGYTISGLYINRPNADYVGLFGNTGGANGSGTIKDLTVRADTVIGKNYVGVVAGMVASRGGAYVTNCNGSGVVKGSNYVGGIVGWSQNLNTSRFEGTVVGDTIVGGVAGYSQSTTDSYFKGTVSGITNVGGLVGEQASSFIGSQTIGSVSGKVAVGGLIGRSNNGTISASSSASIVTGDSLVGGLLGVKGTMGNIKSSYSTGDVSGRTSVGGLVGFFNGYGSSASGIDTSYAIGSVTATGAYVGGLIGYANRINITLSYATGDVTSDSAHVGGLVGIGDTITINQSYASGRIESFKNTGYVGGLIGYNNGGTISDSYFAGSVYGLNTYLGGLAGENRGEINRCYSFGAVIQKQEDFPGYYNGGLVGSNVGGTLSQCILDTAVSVKIYLSGSAPNSGTGTIVLSYQSTTDEMRPYTTYSQVGWSITGATSVWYTNGDHYPSLRNLPTQTITYRVEGPGTIRGNINQIVNLGASAPVVAVPDSGKDFIGWSDGVKTAERLDRDLAVSEKTVTAVFGTAYTLRYTTKPNGVIVGDTLQIVASGSDGKRVTAVADDGYEFLMWSDSVKTQERTDRGVSKDIDVYPIFVEEGTISVSHLTHRRSASPLVTIRAKSLVINADNNVAVRVKLLNLKGRAIANFRSTGNATHSLRLIPAGAYIVEAKRSDGYRVVMPITIK